MGGHLAAPFPAFLVQGQGWGSSICIFNDPKKGCSSCWPEDHTQRPRERWLRGVLFIGALGPRNRLSPRLAESAGRPWPTWIWQTFPGSMSTSHKSVSSSPRPWGETHGYGLFPFLF